MKTKRLHGGNLGFSINTNLDAVKSYNAIAKLNSQVQKAQLRIASGKRINSVADDTSGFNIGKSLESKVTVQKSKLNNAGDAKNYLATAESALMNISDLLVGISAKYSDSQDPTKNKDSIASDIRSYASEIDSILKSTKYNNTNLLAQSDGSSKPSSDVFDVGTNVTMDFADSSYLNADSLKSALNGNPGVASYTSATFDEDATFGGGALTLIIEKDGEEVAHMVPDYLSFNGSNTFGEVADAIKGWIDGNSGININVAVNHNGANSTIDLTSTDGKAITRFYNDSTFDLAGIGIGSGDFVSAAGGLLSSTTDEVLTAASDISAITKNVKSALGRIGNLTQTLNYRADFLTQSIANSTATISKIFDADMAFEQLNTTRGTINVNAAMSMFSQLNNQQQQYLSLLG